MSINATVAKRLQDVRDTDITLDEATHEYTHEPSGRRFASVGELVKRQFGDFDFAGIAAMQAARQGCDPLELKREYEEKGRATADAGRRCHKLVEQFLTGDAVNSEHPHETDEVRVMMTQFCAFNRMFLSEYELTHVEWRIFSERFGVAGTLDALFHTRDGRTVMYDWKFRKTLNEAELQKIATAQGIYGLILLFHYGIKVDQYRVGQFHHTRKRGGRMIDLKPDLGLCAELLANAQRPDAPKALVTGSREAVTMELFDD